MARWTYAFSNGSYNDWHRRFPDLAGIDIDALTQELHIDARHEFEEPLERLVSQNLLAWEGSTLSLTSQGFTFADSVAAAFF